MRGYPKKRDVAGLRRVRSALIRSQDQRLTRWPAAPPWPPRISGCGACCCHRERSCPSRSPHTILSVPNGRGADWVQLNRPAMSAVGPLEPRSRSVADFVERDGQHDRERDED